MNGFLVGALVGWIVLGLFATVAQISDFFAEERAREQVRHEHPELFRHES